MTDAPPDNLPAERPLSDAEKQRARMDALMAAVEARAEMLEKLLADTGISFSRFLEVFRRAIIRGQGKDTTNLLLADAGSVIEACINACTDGLLPDGRQGAIVLYNVNMKARKSDPDRWVKRANWQPMYQGLLDIAYSSGNFRSIEARVVYDGDLFEYELGDAATIKHRPKTRPAGAPAPAIVAAYAVAKTVNGGVFREVFEGADIEKVNKVSKATSGPAKDWPEEMARKGPLRRMWKFLPKNEAMNRIAERDNDGFDLAALEEEPAAPVRERKLSAGFAKPPAQLTQGADQVVDTTSLPAEDSFPGDLEPAETPSNPEAKSNMASPEPPADEPPPKEASDFETMISAAGNWAAVKHALVAFSKTEVGGKDAFDRIARSRAWTRMLELRDAGKDKTDFVSDALLFECWLLGAEPSPDAVVGNWEIVQTSKPWDRLAEGDKARITARVAEALPDAQP